MEICIAGKNYENERPDGRDDAQSGFTNESSLATRTFVSLQSTFSSNKIDEVRAAIAIEQY